MTCNSGGGRSKAGGATTTFAVRIETGHFPEAARAGNLNLSLIGFSRKHPILKTCRQSTPRPQEMHNLDQTSTVFNIGRTCSKKLWGRDAVLRTNIQVRLQAGQNENRLRSPSCPHQ